MKFNFIKKLKEIFSPEAGSSCGSGLAMGIFRQARIESAAQALNKGILPEDELKKIYGETVLAEARIHRTMLEPPAAKR